MKPRDDYFGGCHNVPMFDVGDDGAVVDSGCEGRERYVFVSADSLADYVRRPRGTSGGCVMTNRHAERVAGHVDQYRADHDAHEHVDDVVADMFADLMHYASVHGSATVDGTVARAVASFDAEQANR